MASVRSLRSEGKNGRHKRLNDQLYKADGGKLSPLLLFEGCPRSLMLITAVLSYGAQKYEAHSWKAVAQHRYRDAKLRHWLEELAGLGITDVESGLLHKAHEATNALFVLEQDLEPLSVDEFKKLLKFNPPPQDHKQPVRTTWADRYMIDEGRD